MSFVIAPFVLLFCMVCVYHFWGKPAWQSVRSLLGDGFTCERARQIVNGCKSLQSSAYVRASVAWGDVSRWVAEHRLNRGQGAAFTRVASGMEETMEDDCAVKAATADEA